MEPEDIRPAFALSIDAGPCGNYVRHFACPRNAIRQANIDSGRDFGNAAAILN
jgi:hypothetical protein